MSTVLAGDRAFAVHDYFDDLGPAQEALRIARARDGHALCSCVQPPRRLVIREVRGTCYLALWPNDGHLHHTACPFYRDHQVDDAAAVPSASIRLNADGLWDIALDSLRPLDAAPVERSSGTSSPSPAAAHDAPTPRRPRLPIEGLLHWLWTNSSLNRWGPGWKRDWWRVERELTSASATAVVAGESLCHLMYVPPAFRRDREAAIRASWDAFATRLKPNDAGTRSAALLVGHVKDIEPSPYGYRLSLRHFASRLYVDPPVYAALAKQAPLALSMVKLQQRMRCAVVGIFEVTMSAKGYLQVRGGALMLTGERFVTVSNLHELALVNVLTAQERRFERPEPVANFCDFLLLDTARPTALEVFSLDSRDYQAMKQERQTASRDRGCDIWSWQISRSRECPPLPLPR